MQIITTNLTVLLEIACKARVVEGERDKRGQWSRQSLRVAIRGENNGGVEFTNQK